MFFIYIVAGINKKNAIRFINRKTFTLTSNKVIIKVAIQKTHTKGAIT